MIEATAMDIYSFLRSPDVAAHCRNINKTWNTFEVAVIISRSICTIHEKHAEIGVVQ